MDEKSTMFISRDFIIVWLIPPTLYEYTLDSSGGVYVSLSQSFVEFHGDTYGNIVDELRIIHDIWPKCMSPRRRGEDIIRFRFLGRFREHLHRAYFLSRLARSKGSLLVSWIIAREYILRLLREARRHDYFPLGVEANLSDSVEITHEVLGKYGLRMSLGDFMGLLPEGSGGVAKYTDDGIHVVVGPSIEYMRDITSDMTPERFRLMELICLNAPVHAYTLTRMGFHLLWRRKSWVYRSVEVLEKYGLVVRAIGVRGKEAGRGRARKIILPTCIAWYYAPCLLELTNPNTTLRLREKPREFSCVMGFREDEIFHEPNRKTLDEFIDRVSRLGVRISRGSRSIVLEIIRNVPCPILRRALEILYDLMEKAAIARGTEITISGRKKERWSALELINNVCRLLRIPFSIEPEDID